MCGFAGIIDDNRESSIPCIKTMTRLLTHRGPDEEGYYLGQGACLGHRRLRVIDLVAGQQPLPNEDRTVWVVFNGEIYNFQELRKELLQKGHRFTTQTDTEVIVHLYEEGDNFIQRLDGMFALAVWDERRKRLTLARDRIGKKPLFYAHLGSKLYFASELKALLCVSEISKTLDMEALQYFLTLNYVPGSRSLFEAIRKLEPAHRLIFENAAISQDPYWQLPTQNKGDIAEEDDALEALSCTLSEAIKKRLVSDVPLGVFLSGGIDSSLVVALLRKMGVGSIKTFSIGFEDKVFNETEKARTISKYFETNHHEYILNPRLTDILPKIIWHSDEPSGDSSSFPTYLLAEACKKEITVAFSGDGGDEFFGGYNSYMADIYIKWYQRLPFFLRKQVLLPLIQSLPTTDHPFENKLKRFIRGGILSPLEAHYQWQNRIFTPEEKCSIFKSEWRDQIFQHNPFRLFSELEQQSRFQENLDLFMYVDQRTCLADGILAKVDRMSMAHALEVRCPILDTKVIELAYRIPVHLKIRHGSKKHLLKQLLGTMIPKSLFSNKKKGFGIPVHRWLREDLRDFLHDALFSNSLTQLGFFETQAIQKLFEDHVQKKANHGHILWTLMVFAIWYEQCKNPYTSYSSSKI